MTGGRKHYPGTDEKAFGYGGITDCGEYLRARLGDGTRLLSETLLPVSMEDNCVLSGRPPVENCSVAAVARVFLFWDRLICAKSGEPPADAREVYRLAEKLAAERYRYTDRRGLDFWLIDDLSKDVFAQLGRPADCRGIYLWNFQRDIASEIKSGRPVILNVATGYYVNHTVTVAGYRLYEQDGYIFPMLCLADGWQSGRRWLHLDSLKKEFGLFGIASVNQIRPVL